LRREAAELVRGTRKRLSHDTQKVFDLMVGQPIAHPPAVAEVHDLLTVLEREVQRVLADNANRCSRSQSSGLVLANSAVSCSD
jgi:hypothetical protein